MRSIFLLPLAIAFLFELSSFASAQGALSQELYNFREDEIVSRSEVHISQYVFHDLNRSGTYDLGDRSMAHVVVAVGDGETAVAAVRSNVNGFANISTSATGEDALINHTGTFEYVVIPPPGSWVTTGNGTQLIDVIVVPDTNGLLAAARMPDPVGIAQYTFIRGTYEGNLPAVARVVLNGETIAESSVHPDGQFLIPIDSGEYLLEVGDSQRDVQVGGYPVDIGTMSVVSIDITDAETLGFDDLAPLGLQKVPNGYGGIGWFNLNAMSSQFTPDGVGYQNGTTSGFNIAYTSSGHPAELYHEDGFDFLSANITVAWPDGEGEQVVFEYYREEELIATDSIGLSAYGPISYQPMMENVTFIKITPLHYWQVIFDDVQISVD